MSANHRGGDSAPDSESETNQAVELLTTLGAAVFVAGWSLFWGHHATLLYAEVGLLSAVFAVVAVVVPALVAFGWYAAESHGYSVLTPDVDADVIGS